MTEYYTSHQGLTNRWRTSTSTGLLLSLCLFSVAVLFSSCSEFGRRVDLSVENKNARWEEIEREMTYDGDIFRYIHREDTLMLVYFSRENIYTVGPPYLPILPLGIFFWGSPYVDNFWLRLHVESKTGWHLEPSTIHWVVDDSITLIPTIQTHYNFENHWITEFLFDYDITSFSKLTMTVDSTGLSTAPPDFVLDTIQIHRGHTLFYHPFRFIAH